MRYVSAIFSLLVLITVGNAAYGAAATVHQPSFFIWGYTLVDIVPASQGRFDLKYKAILTNKSNHSFSGVSASVSIDRCSANTSFCNIIDGSLVFGSVGPWKSILSADTFAIRATSRSPLLIYLLKKSWSFSPNDTNVFPFLDRSPDLAGPDSDSNGIRDDVDAHIATLPISPDQKIGVDQLATSLQGALLIDVNDEIALRQARKDISLAIQCISIKFPDISQRSSIFDEIEKIIFNTRERSMQYIAYNSALSGSVSKLLSGNTCWDSVE